MTQRIPNITRRRLLASTGTAGIAVLAGLSFRPATVSGDTPPYTDTTYAQTDVDGLSLRVAWHSTYNDRTVSASLDSSDGRTVPGHTEPNETGQDPSDGFTDGGNAETHGPLIAASNVLPGDSGTIAIGLFAERMDARVRLIPTVSGRLSEIVDIALWYDTGLFGIGGCRGSETIPDDPPSSRRSRRSAKRTARLSMGRPATVSRFATVSGAVSRRSASVWDSPGKSTNRSATSGKGVPRVRTRVRRRELWGVV